MVSGAQNLVANRFVERGSSQILLRKDATMSNQEFSPEKFVNDVNRALSKLIFKSGEPYVIYPKENLIPPIEKIIFNPPATIVFWDDGEKTVVKCKESDEFDYECGLAFAIAKRYFGSRSEFKKAIGKAKKITNDPDSDTKSLGYYMLGYKSKSTADALSKIHADMTNYK